MLINCDIKGLEWVGVNYLSQDSVGMAEILEKVNTHEVNRARFNLPERRIAKIFVFRLIYGGGAWSYANDPDFSPVSSSEKFWQNVIDQFYDKYKGIHRWHTEIVQTVSKEKRLVLPTGRVFTFEKNKYGEWPRTTILNYPVQGLGAELMKIGRISFHRRLKQSGLPGLLISTIHDSLVVDTPKEFVYNICKMLKESIEDIPKNFFRLFGVKFNLPMECEIAVGPNKKDMTIFNV